MPTWLTGLLVNAWIARSASARPRKSHTSPVAAVASASSSVMVPSCTARNLRHGCGSPGSSSASPAWPVSRRRAARSPSAGAARSAEYDPEELRERLRSRLAEATPDGAAAASAGRRLTPAGRRGAPSAPEASARLSGSRGTRRGGWPPRSAASRASGPRPRAPRRCAARSATRAGRRPAAPGGARRAGTRSGRSRQQRRAAVAVTAPGRGEAEAQRHRAAALAQRIVRRDSRTPRSTRRRRRLRRGRRRRGRRAAGRRGGAAAAAWGCGAAAGGAARCRRPRPARPRR